MVTPTNFIGALAINGQQVYPGNSMISMFGTAWYVDTVNGNDGNGGNSADDAFKSMERAFERISANDTIFFVGKVREQLVAPLLGADGKALTGVSIVGCANGNVRDDDGAKWYAPATPTAGKALIEIRQQGWMFSNFLMSPDTTSGACIKAHRNEDADYPDSSHFICRGMRFVGTGGTTYGIEDVGGNHHYIVDGCEFQTLTTAIYCSSTAIAVPLRNTIVNNKFMGNTNDINTSLSYSLIQGNRFFSDNTIKISTVANSGQGGNNVVTENTFPDASADIDPGNGYDGAATDTWTNNWATDAVVFGDPA